jgi:protein TonB
MIRGLEFAGFLALAAAVHAGFWSVAPEGGGAGGENGADTVTLTASSPQMAALVEAWQRPVEAMPEAPAARRAPVSDTPPAGRQPDAAPRPALPLTILPDPTTAPRAPRIDTTPLPAPAPALSGSAPSAAQPPDAPHEDTRPPARRPASAERPAAPDAPRAPAMAARPQVDRSPQAAQAPPPDTRPRARPARERQREVARGTGGTQAGGRAQTTAPARISDATRASLMGQWGGAIRARIERQKRYPPGTRASGTVHLVLDVGGDGRLLGVALRRSSGNNRLDTAAMNAVRRARLPAAPDRLAGARHRFSLPVAFTR